MIQCLCGGFGDFQLGSQADPSLESLISVNSNLDIVDSVPLFAAVNLCASVVFIIHAPRVFGATVRTKNKKEKWEHYLAVWLAGFIP